MTTLKLQDRPVVAMLYVVALLVVVDQTLDWVGVIFPLRLELTTWRFGAFGLALARMAPLAIADALLLSAALLLEHRRTLTVLAIVHAVLALLLGLGLVLFLLDGLELRNSITAERKREVMVAAGRTVLTAGVAIVACLTITVGLLRSRREQKERQLDKPRESYLVGAAGTRADV